MIYDKLKTDCRTTALITSEILIIMIIIIIKNDNQTRKYGLVVESQMSFANDCIQSSSNEIFVFVFSVSCKMETFRVEST
jgi:hypothetical protein